MSTDPTSGIAYITMYDSANGQLSDGAQFSGVLIAPDEILTVAHGVTDETGKFRSVGTAYLGHDGGALTGGVSIASVHVVDASHPFGMETDSQVASDFAVVHLSQPVATAQTFTLGLGGPGTYTASGYPAVNGGSLTSVTESMSAGYATGELTGRSLIPTGSAAGASGSPVYSTPNGVPTVNGLVVADDHLGGMSMLSLTQADIAQIDAWVYSDDASQPWGSTFAPGQTVTQSSGGGATGTTTGTTTGTSAPPDRLDHLASLLTLEATGTTGVKEVMMTDIAAAIGVARQQGATGSDLPDSTDMIADALRGSSSVANRAIAYMAGMMASESGIARSRVVGYIANAFGIGLNKSTSQVALAGYAEDKAIASQTVGAAIPDPLMASRPAQGLADALGASLGDPGSAATPYDTALLNRPVPTTSIIARQADHPPFG